MRIFLYLEIILLLFINSNVVFAKDAVSSPVRNFYIGGSYGYDKKALELKVADKYLDFDLHVDDIIGYNIGLKLGYICPSASLNNFRTDLEFVYIAKREMVTENVEESLKKEIVYWNDNKYKVFFNLYYDMGNFFSIRDLAFYFGSGIDAYGLIVDKLSKKSESSNIKSNFMLQNVIGLKYILYNVAIYGGYKYFFGYTKSKKDNVVFKNCKILGSYGLIFGLEFIF
ncbi:Uncharacterized protein ehr_00832 [Ehrlichia minasensis]|nr:Uncharacterized protein ehr_00832 [Ehrlichia minasensis]